MLIFKEKNAMQFKISKIVCAQYVFLAAIFLIGCSSKQEETSKEKVVTPVTQKVVEKETTKVVNTVSYGVQIGAYKKFDAEFTSTVKKVEVNGLQHYVLGNFATVKEANNLQKILMDLGVKDAFVVKLENNKIVKF
ncbi:SPOR domain-containing protein [Wenyingzhuangia aestuarii]|uniref:SPOR domain-containing protein n=1 Tax=Wenyingzhuangia aestuarii TaxID=1647582 RepID=UPI00143A0890|nr:SPOR domain-containing protein [Wenyingzhuangia aestuarii]NJB81511.1 cell division protein FtsN [Wenyingzhuangia aestuarii]